MKRLARDIVATALAVTLFASGCRSCERSPPPAGGAAAGSDAATGGTGPGDARAVARGPRTTVLARLGVEPPAETAFHFSEEGGSVAWIVSSPEGVRVAWNGTEDQGFVAVDRPVLSADGRHLAYSAMDGKKWRMVRDARVGAPFDELDRPVFSPDGAHLAWQARAGEDWLLLVDAKEVARSRARHGELQFGADSRSLLFIAGVEGLEGQGRLVRLDVGKGRLSTLEERVSELVLDPGRKAWAAIAMEGGRQRLVWGSVDGAGRPERGPAQDSASQVAIGPGGKGVAWVAIRDGAQYLVLDGRETPLPPEDQAVELPAVRPDGLEAAFAIVSGNRLFVRRQFGDQREPLAVDGSVSEMTFSPRGARLACVDKKGGKERLLVDGKETLAFDRVLDLKFSPDGSRLVFRAREDGKRFVVVADGEGRLLRKHPPHDQVFPIRIAPDGQSVSYGAKDGPTLAWVQEPL